MNNKDARAARDAGILQAAEHAEEVCTGWGDKAYEALRVFAEGTRKGQPFTSEQVRSSIAAAFVPKPPHARAWGSVFQRAARNGLIQKVGVAQSEAVHCHMSYVGQWKAV